MNIKTTGDLFTASANSHSRAPCLLSCCRMGEKQEKGLWTGWRETGYTHNLLAREQLKFVTSLHSTYLCKQRNIVLVWKAVNTEAIFILLKVLHRLVWAEPLMGFFSLVPCFHHIWFLPTRVLFAFDRSGHYSRKKNRERTTTPHKDLASSVKKISEVNL